MLGLGGRIMALQCRRMVLHSRMGAQNWSRMWMTRRVAGCEVGDDPNLNIDYGTPLHFSYDEEGPEKDSNARMIAEMGKLIKHFLWWLKDSGDWIYD